MNAALLYPVAEYVHGHMTMPQFRVARRGRVVRVTAGLALGSLMVALAGCGDEGATPSAGATTSSDVARKSARAAIVLKAAVTRQRHPTPDEDPQSTDLALNSPRASALPGILRSCEDARDFTVYTLGERIDDLYASSLDASCQKPPPIVDGKVAIPTRHNDTEVFYGPCRGGGSSGCGNDLSVRSTPSCERPYSLYTAFTGSPKEDLEGPRLTTLRGVPAARFEDRIELWTRDTTIVVFGDPKLARRAIDALRSTSGAVSAGEPLPKPAEDIMDPHLSTVACAS